MSDALHKATTLAIVLGTGTPEERAHIYAAKRLRDAIVALESALAESQAKVKPSRADLLRAIHPELTEQDMRVASTLIDEEAARLHPDCIPRRHHEARAKRFRPPEEQP